MWRRTSGNVPLEKTLCNSQHRVRAITRYVLLHSHEQAGLSTGAITNNDQLATDIRHLRDPLMTLLDNARQSFR